MTILIKNNTFGFLADGASDSDTLLTLQAGEGGRFPAVAPGEYFHVTLQSFSGDMEIVRVVGRAADDLTVVRGQEGTTPTAFDVGSLVELRVTVHSTLETVAQYVSRTQHVAPSDGFNVTVNAVTDGVSHNTWLLIDPATALYGGTIVLPTGAARFPGQWVAVTTAQQVLGLVINGNGAVVSNAPGSMGADATFRLQYAEATNTWYRCD